mmetsp:Transcript_3447/g.21618  ORF Transcript_3447/g.21618 Transcript_3447/m.21618 type:complete len:232 (+) Transcript_3447:2703-3398(+)
MAMAKTMHVRSARAKREVRARATRSLPTMPSIPTMPQFAMPQFQMPELPWQKGPKREDKVVDELLELVEGSDAGANMSDAKRAEVQELVEKLAGRGEKRPARSKLLEAEYDVVYTDNAIAAGGPFRTAPGRAIFWTDAITQVIEGGKLHNRVDFHLLGLVPGAVTLDAEVDVLADDRLRARFGRPQLQLAGKVFEIGKESATEQEVLYLDERIRVSRGLSARASLLVFKKL